MITPYKAPRERPRVAWLLDHATCIDEDYAVLRLEQVGDCQVWAAHDLIVQLLQEGHGEALCWDNKPIRWSPQPGTNRWDVRSLLVSYPDDPEACVAGLATWRDWLGGYGAAPAGSLGGTGFSLLKATLEKPLWTSVGELPPIWFTLGGRQEVGIDPPALFKGDIGHYDIQGAYARQLGELRYGGRWVRIEPPRAYPLRREQHGRLVYVRAVVDIPDDLPLGPLPVRPRSEPNKFESLMFNPVYYPTGRDLQGTWTWDELVTAEQAGCRIRRVLGVWVHAAGQMEYPFAPWYAAVLEGRRLAGFAGVLAKAAGNATWGMLSLRKAGRRTAMRREVGAGGRSRRLVRVLPVKGGNPSQRAPDLAETITGRVRAQLYEGMLAAGPGLICAHTDGLWCFGAPPLAGGWRRKAEAVALRLVNPQNLAYVKPDDSEVYVVAGISSKYSGPWFEDQWRRLQEERSGRPYALGGPVPPDPIPTVAA